ncbi:transcription cofactor vestigial-like protein 1 [Elephas maximus indicus]|uniref:transcription cofactor vestigial-like protein 1 n=1 Tax=Elephas maximus indicus TaxID=99487 RepID=UPI0021170356|nr:transcription cofactor vestigial-like protein 1 [Elephas maximus indicus]XP_049728907.1 transcription cofactor vestigial-like protein 1 [Elephas maximus indicus]
MEETKKTSKSKQKPIKTEWNSRCVLFTYFQGDISSVVDEHFSRALSNIKSPQRLSPSGQSREATGRNDTDMSPNQWHLSSQWRKPQPEGSPANGAASCGLNASGSSSMAVDPYPLPLTGSPSAQPGELWHFSSLASPSSPEPGYSHAFPGGSLVPEPKPDGKCEPLVSLLQQERCLSCPQEPTTSEDSNSAQTAGRAGVLLDLPPDSTHYKKIHFSPNRGASSASLANESK